ncbi:hypothetical protein CHS0354_002887 [Potamilus streckersoni]|uniref:tRNA-intron lyase n=1 Tax=Potamilus streckersoni TaxID=2493646 RepID=A0AAE0SNB5_9BIVA|nr:hypothetical protein CHS0354_002887 [Potamilus streckersoni]
MSAPRRKKRVQQANESPFPVPIATVTQEAAGRKQWFYYTGVYHGNHVTVHHSGDIHFLYKMGFFGKGMLSRSCPDFNQRKRTVHIPIKGDLSGESTQLKVMSRRQYLLHKRWSESCDLKLTNQEEEMESSSSYSDPEEEMDDVSGSNVEDSSVTCWDIHQNSHGQTNDSGALQEQKTVKVSQELSCKQEEDLNSRTGSEAVTRNFAKDSWEDAEMDEGFWRTESASRIETTKVKNNWDDDEVDNDFWSTETAVDNTKHLDKRDLTDLSDIESNIPDESNTNLKTDTLVQCRLENKDKSDIAVSDNTQMRKDIQHENEMDKETNGCFTCDQLDKENGISKTSETNLELDLSHDVVCSEQLECGELESQTDNQTVKSKNKADDSDGDTFVIDDSDSDRERRKKRKRIQWIPAVKKNPYIVTEDLRLNLEEAFFLSFGLGCLLVLDQDKTPMTLSAMWQKFSNSQSRFVPKYIAYHHFRSKGWVPKSGLKFGADFILYRVGPPFYHGSYSVIVRTVFANTLQEVPQFTDREFTWTTLSGFNRATEHVAKEVLICYVIIPENLSVDELQSSAKYISQCQVNELHVTRWVSAQEREGKHNVKEEIP